ncbi:helix-turn-helix domain-containing protein [Sorangium sp. So ce1014]|uniref:helix-turn-helix domain-containing protein n=1 Tax=Sorangium sp. So ce1014 TaxID=3133326 RepID=UPI003F5E4222
MRTTRSIRGSDHALVQRITHVAYGDDTQDQSLPDGCWDLVFMKHRGRLQVLHTGLITHPVTLGYETGDEYLSIAFRPGVFMPGVPAMGMLDQGVLRPLANPRSFLLGPQAFEVPDFENADDLVARIIGAGLLVADPVVFRVLQGDPAGTSLRSVQRRFLSATGLTAKQLSQIHRAQAALQQLMHGDAPADVAAACGYADQAHLGNSLKRIMGRTPGEVVRAAARPGPRR